jgi:hypothetical protein
MLNQTITFKNLTFQTGSSVAGTLRTYSFAPGYRYDIIHRPRGHLGIVAQVNLLDIKATLTGVAIQSSTQTTTSTASGSVFAPLPVFGSEGRAYFARNRLFIEATLKGMYFLGYGNFITTAGTVGVTLTPHIDFIGGYQRLTQCGPTVGLAFNF